MKTCTVDGCERKHVARGYCTTHYIRLRRWGSLEKHKVPAPVTLELVLERGRVDQTGDCWIWNSTTRQGYGCIGVGGRGGKVWQAHRLVFELVTGPIPADLVVHHVCRTRRCVNPDHMELVTRSEHPTLHAGERRAA